MKLRSLVTALFVGLAIPALAAEPNVTVIHGIPGGDLGQDAALPVDVCVIDSSGTESAALPGVPFGASAALALPPGFYNLNIRLADATPCTGAVAVPVSFSVSLAESSTVIAHLSEQGTPTFTKYVNDLRALAADRGRVVVRHVAAAPPVNVSLKGRNLASIRDLRNPEQSVSADLRAGAYQAVVSPAAGGRRVLGPTWWPARRSSSTPWAASPPEASP